MLLDAHWLPPQARKEMPGGAATDTGRLSASTQKVQHRNLVILTAELSPKRLHITVTVESCYRLGRIKGSGEGCTLWPFG